MGSPNKPYLTGRSRLEAEFEELESVGSGGFGDVVKVGVVCEGCECGKGVCACVSVCVCVCACVFVHVCVHGACSDSDGAE